MFKPRSPHRLAAAVLAVLSAGVAITAAQAPPSNEPRSIAAALKPLIKNRTLAGADRYHKQRLEPDMAEQRRAATNAIPRRCGRFYWRQVANAVQAGATMLYGAMFDEVDEGTAMFKMVADAQDLPADPPFLSLDADGCALPGR